VKKSHTHTTTPRFCRNYAGKKKKKSVINPRHPAGKGRKKKKKNPVINPGQPVREGRKKKKKKKKKIRHRKRCQNCHVINRRTDKGN
jgi:hypothetical protein